MPWNIFIYGLEWSDQKEYLTINSIQHPLPFFVYPLAFLLCFALLSHDFSFSHSLFSAPLLLAHLSSFHYFSSFPLSLLNFLFSFSLLLISQLRNAGMMETIRIRQQGYAFRAPHKEFFKRYLPLEPSCRTLQVCFPFSLSFSLLLYLHLFFWSKLNRSPPLNEESIRIILIFLIVRYLHFSSTPVIFLISFLWFSLFFYQNPQLLISTCK